MLGRNVVLGLWLKLFLHFFRSPSNRLTCVQIKVKSSTELLLVLWAPYTKALSRKGGEVFNVSQTKTAFLVGTIIINPKECTSGRVFHHVNMST